jgi:predicted helicase
MACGTGKTLVAASVAARLAAGGVTVFLAPSIALVAQVLREFRGYLTGCRVQAEALTGPGRLKLQR